MKLPLIPARDEQYTVVEYPSNAQVRQCAKIILRSEGVSDDQKKEIAANYKIPQSEMSDDLAPDAADLEIARLVFQEDIPDGVTGADLSPKAVREATENFMGIESEMRDGLMSILQHLTD